MISALFCVMVVLVGSAAAGSEIRDELDRIRRDEMPAQNEVRHPWDEPLESGVDVNADSEGDLRGQR